MGAIINIGTFLLAPLILLWGWVKYLQMPTRSDWRSRASLVGLTAPLLSVFVWGVMLALSQAKGWNTSTPVVHASITVGVWIPTLGMLIGFAGRPLLILSVVPASIATVWFWYGSTLP